MPKRIHRNRGWFLPGFDPRRHVLTTAERRLGGFNAVRRHYLGGGYAVYLGQDAEFKDLSLQDLALLSGDGDQPGRRPRAAAAY